jgi:23S rRNA (uridine2552-2'-O)-methyltransferase
VIDLGAAPGGWTQVAVEKTGSSTSRTSVLAIDRDSMHAVPGAHFILGDIEDDKTRVQIKEFFKMEPVDVVLSDMAPNFMGDQDVDHMGVAVLNAIALRVCFHNLKIGGTLLMKTLYGTNESRFFVSAL